MKKPFLFLAVVLTLGSNVFAESFAIHGSVSVPGDGCDKARVFLCDASGQPLCRINGQPFTTVLGTTNETAAMTWWFSIPDAKGHFQFTNVPAGNYIVVGQAWNSPTQPTNFTTFRCETIHLLGRAMTTVPAPDEIKLTPPGTRTIQFRQDFGNNDGLLLLSTGRQRGDAIMGWVGWGTNFTRHLVGYNWMPQGRTTVHGAPEECYASIFMNDNSPGFGSIQVAPDAPNPVKMPIVAGWSDGYKVPPTNLVWLVELVQTNHFDVDGLLGIPKGGGSENFIEKQRMRARQVNAAWDKQIHLPTGQTVSGADFMTAVGYTRLRSH